MLKELFIGFYFFAASYHSYPDMNGEHNLIGLRLNDTVNVISFVNSFEVPSKAIFLSGFNDYGIGYYFGATTGYVSGKPDAPSIVVAPVYRKIFKDMEFNLSCLSTFNEKMDFACVFAFKTIDFQVR